MKDLKTDLKPVRIVLLGFTGSGKRSSQNTILDLGPPLTNHRKAEGVVAGRLVTVVDTPGWYRKAPVVRTAELVRREIECSVFRCVPGPHAFLLLVNVDAPFGERDRRSLVEHMELLGDRVWAHTLLLFTFGDWLGETSVQEHIQSEGAALQWLVEKCGRRYHLLSNVGQPAGSQVTELLEKIEKMASGNGEEAFYQVKLDVMGMEVDDGVEVDDGADEEDWKYVWEKTTPSVTSKKVSSMGFPPPSFGSEDRSGYGSLKSSPGYDCSSSERSWA